MKKTRVPAQRPSVLIASEPRRVLRAFSDEMHLLLDGSLTNRQLSVWINVTPPGGGPPPHRHEREDEWFHVLEGRVSFWDGERWTEVPVGSVVYAPRGTIHTFRNVGETPLRMQISVSPSGFEEFFAECAQVFGQERSPDFAKVVEISARHGIYYVPELPV